MKEPLKITVGIPAYNVEQYAYESIKSAMDQTYRNLEILVVDDGSTDGTGFIADKLAEQDARIRVIHQENKGLAEVRNVIIDEMTGDAVYWLDSDDYITPDAVAVCAGLMEAADAGIVKTVVKKKEEYLAGIYSREEYEKILLPDTINANVIGCLIRKELYAGVRHPAGRHYEAYYTIPKVVEHTDRVVVSVNGTYHYRVCREGSITGDNRRTFKGYYEKAVAFEDRHSRYPEAEHVLRDFVNQACMACLYAGEDDGNEVMEVRNLLSRHEAEIAISGEVTPYKKWLVRTILSHGSGMKVAECLHKGKAKLMRIMHR